MAPFRQSYVRMRVRSLVEAEGEWGSTDKSWEDIGTATTQRAMGLGPIEGSRRLERMGAEYSADWHALTRAKPAIEDGSLIETLDGNDDVVQRFIVKKVLPRGRYVSILLEENPNIQAD